MLNKLPLFRRVGACLILWLATACAARRPAPPSADAAVPVPVPAPGLAQIRSQEARAGTVRAIGAGRRFVLVETPSFSAAALLAPGRLLHCRAPGAGPLSTADLRVTREREQAFVAADVLAGDPQVGDAVFLAAGEPAQTPAVSPLPISSVLPPLLSVPSPAPTP